MDPEHVLSPLDQIRQAEADSARRVAGCREGAERAAARAREQARALVEAEREAGQREGQAQYRRLMLRAQDEVRVICLDSQKRVAELQRAEVELMGAAVTRVLAIITGIAEGER
ncbi:MAG: hypothetical protein RRC07_09500 [Anaerolineae bacterium]|nr:hypothetical protein [Anaerolineae bacterium]